MDELQRWSGELFTLRALLPFVRAAVLLVVGFLVARMLAAGIDRAATSRLSDQHRMIARRVVFYGLMGVVIATALREVGVDLTVLLGAAGVLSVAVGFASQTSASNLISGLFLLGEQPFVLGDRITVEGITGEVVSIDLLSVKLRTFDNLLVRLPNETLLKTPITNLTHFPIRRFELKLRIPIHEDVERVRALLMEVADRVPICLDEPQPQLLLLGYSDMGMELQFNVWAATPNFLELRYEIQRQVQEALIAAGIRVPGPQRMVQGPVEVRLVRPSEPAPPSEPDQHAQR